MATIRCLVILITVISYVVDADRFSNVKQLASDKLDDSCGKCQNELYTSIKAMKHQSEQLIIDASLAVDKVRKMPERLGINELLDTATRISLNNKILGDRIIAVADELKLLDVDISETDRIGQDLAATASHMQLDLRAKIYLLNLYHGAMDNLEANATSLHIHSDAAQVTDLRERGLKLSRATAKLMLNASIELLNAIIVWDELETNRKRIALQQNMLRLSSAHLDALMTDAKHYRSGPCATQSVV